jgi:predicted phage replisome organizer
MLQAGECNNDGAVYFTENIPYTTNEFATEYGFQPETVERAIKVFESFGTVEVLDENFVLKNWDEYQNTCGLEKIREQTRKCVAKYKEKQETHKTQAKIVNCTHLLRPCERISELP